MNLQGVYYKKFLLKKKIVLWWGYLTLWFKSYGSSDGKEFTCSIGDLALIPGSGRSPWEGNG